VERAGNFKHGGSITAFYTVLVEGDDFNEPVSDHMRAILDGHIVLTRRLANKRHYPAVDILESISRLVNDLATDEEQKLLTESLKLASLYNDSKDMIDVGAYEEGKNAELDRAVAFVKDLDVLLQQEAKSSVRRSEFMQQLHDLLTKQHMPRRKFERPRGING
jgi:flagellum-specific ATP synthase